MAVAAGISAVVGVVGAVSGSAAASSQASIGQQQIALQKEQFELQKQQQAQALTDAEQDQANQEVRRTATLAERERERRISRARSQALESQQIRARINEARIVSAQQQAAGGEAGFTGTAGAAAADLAAAVGASRTEGAFSTLLQQSQLRQADILNKLVDVKTLPGFKEVDPVEFGTGTGPTPIAATRSPTARRQATSAATGGAGFGRRETDAERDARLGLDARGQGFI